MKNRFFRHLRYRFTRHGFRMLLVEILYRARPGRYCWGDLVMWAMYGPRRIDSGERCRAESVESATQSCYCGQFERGFCWSKLSARECKRVTAARKAHTSAKVDEEEFPF